MKRYILFISASVFFFAACNNSGEDNKTTTDTTTKTSTDTSHSMSNMNMTAAPELPTVPDGAKVFFKSPKNNASVTSPVKVEMGVDKMKVDTAGPVVAASGHFHILVDAEDSIASGTMVPKDSTHLHYGKGQVMDNLKLSPGKHKLTIQFADGLHRSYGSKMASTITVDVKK